MLAPRALKGERRTTPRRSSGRQSSKARLSATSPSISILNIESFSEKAVCIGCLSSTPPGQHPASCLPAALGWLPSALYVRIIFDGRGSRQGKKHFRRRALGEVELIQRRAAGRQLVGGD